jgi:tRNA threonylcarbamoyladenosine biosynthesis protein TsaE
LICLSGPLGAGKTVLVRGLASGLGCAPGEVCSPTYVLERLHPGSRLTLRHMDAYRLSGPEEFEEADLAAGLSAPGAVTALEWADRVAAALPAERLWVRLEPQDGTRRLLRLEAHGKRYAALLRGLAGG